MLTSKFLASFLEILHQLPMTAKAVRPSKSASLPPAYQSKTGSLAIVTPTSRPGAISSGPLPASYGQSSYRPASASSLRATTYSYSFSTDQDTYGPAVTPTATATATATATDDDVCDDTDVNCNYCSAALYAAGYCEEYVAGLGLAPGYAYDCLCYEYLSPTATSLIWSPEYYDEAASSCPLYASTAEPTNLGFYNRFTDLCANEGNYYRAQITDYGTWVLDTVDASTTSDMTGGKTSATGTATATFVRTGGCSRQRQHSSFLSTLPAIVFFAAMI